MGNRKGGSGVASVDAIQVEMDALRAEMARLRRKEMEIAARLSERRRADETALLCSLGRVLLDDLDPQRLPARDDALHYAAKRDLSRRSAWFALRIRAATVALVPRPPLLEMLLARLDEQAAQDHVTVPLARRPEGDKPPVLVSQQDATDPRAVAGTA